MIRRGRRGSLGRVVGGGGRRGVDRGDRVMRGMARGERRRIRTIDLAGAIGGDEEVGPGPIVLDLHQTGADSPLRTGTIEILTEEDPEEVEVPEQEDRVKIVLPERPIPLDLQRRKRTNRSSWSKYERGPVGRI